MRSGPSPPATVKRVRTDRTATGPSPRLASDQRQPSWSATTSGPSATSPGPTTAASSRPSPSISTATPIGSSCTARERRRPPEGGLRCAAVDERTYGVAELGAVIARVVSQTFPGRCWVRGQIRNLTRSAVGHVYFELAEPGPLGEPPDAVVPVTLLASDRQAVNTVMRAAGAGRMDDGMEIRIAGRLTWFSPRGRLQLRMATIDPAYTLGRLGEDRDRLLAALRAEKLLERNRAVRMPDLPLCIGLVTSLGSAAHADFRHELERSGIGFRVLEADARTQGLDAGRSVAVAIARLAARADVVAVVRGG